MTTTIYSNDAGDHEFTKVGSVESSKFDSGRTITEAIQAEIGRLVTSGRVGEGEFIAANEFVARRFRAALSAVKVEKL